MRRRRGKYTQRQLSGLTRLQKLAVENDLDLPAIKAELDKRFEKLAEETKMYIRIKKFATLFRAKTKAMHKPRRRKKKK